MPCSTGVSLPQSGTKMAVPRYDIERFAGIYSAEPSDRKNVRERAGGER